MTVPFSRLRDNHQIITVRSEIQTHFPTMDVLLVAPLPEWRLKIHSESNQLKYDLKENPACLLNYFR